MPPGKLARPSAESRRDYDGTLDRARCTAARAVNCDTRHQGGTSRLAAVRSVMGTVLVPQDSPQWIASHQFDLAFAQVCGDPRAEARMRDRLRLARLCRINKPEVDSDHRGLRGHGHPGQRVRFQQRAVGTLGRAMRNPRGLSPRGLSFLYGQFWQTRVLRIMVQCVSMYQARIMNGITPSRMTAMRIFSTVARASERCAGSVNHRSILC